MISSDNNFDKREIFKALNQQLHGDSARKIFTAKTDPKIPPYLVVLSIGMLAAFAYLARTIHPIVFILCIFAFFPFLILTQFRAKYLFDGEAHVFQKCHALEGIEIQQSSHTFADIFCVSVDYRRVYFNHNKQFHVTSVVLVMKSGEVFQITDWAHDAWVDCNVFGQKLAEIIGCDFVRGENRQKLSVSLNENSQSPDLLFQ